VLLRLLAGTAAFGLGTLAVARPPDAVAAAEPAAPHFVVQALPTPDGVPTPRNEDVEPGIGIDGAGTIWIGSNIDGNTGNDPRTAPGGLLTGEDLWRSTDGGRTFQWVDDPYALSNGTFGLGGEDSDATAAPEKNAQGFYNVYGVSLYVAASTLAFSQDGGKTFQLMQLGGVPAQDRPWVSADGPCTVYLTYHQLPLFLPVVNTYDVCSGPTPNLPSLTINPVSQTQLFTVNSLPGGTNGFNKPAIDTWPTSPHRHNIYVPMEACNLQGAEDFARNAIVTARQLPVCPQGVDTEVEVAASSDGGQSFTTSVVALNDNGEVQVWPTSVAVGPDGSVYVAWSDNHRAWTSVSHDGGSTWSPRLQVDRAPLNTADYPTVAAGPDGRVDIAYYGSTRHGDTNDATAMGDAGKPASAVWRLYLARSTDGARSFRQYVVSGVLHTGELCTQGVACKGSGSRNLYDDFGVAISPVTNRTTIAFDSDETLGPAPAAQAVDPFTAFATELPVVAAGGGLPTAGRPPAAAAGMQTAIATPNTAGDPPAGARPPLLAAALVFAVLALRRRRRRAG
jgi:MYXO-CTERM domain-containing protein